MKRLFAPILLLLLMLAPKAGASITQIQQHFPAPVFSSPGTAAYSSNVTAGNLLIVGTMAYGASVSGIPTDTLGDVFALAVTNNASSGCGGQCNAYIYYAVAKSSGADTVSQAFTGTALAIIVTEYTSINAVGQTNGASGNGGTAASGNIVTTVNNELLFGIQLCAGCTTASTPLTPFSLVATSSGNNGFLAQSAIVSSTGTYNSQATLGSGGTEWVMVVASFFLASGNGQVGAFVLGP